MALFQALGLSYQPELVHGKVHPLLSHFTGLGFRVAFLFMFGMASVDRPFQTFGPHSPARDP